MYEIVRIIFGLLIMISIVMFIICLVLTVWDFDSFFLFKVMVTVFGLGAIGSILTPDLDKK